MAWPKPGLSSHSRHTQRGAVAIEFAFLSIIFFALLYAIIAYALPFFLTLTLKHLSAEAARSAIRIDPATENYHLAVSKQVSDTITNFWSNDWIDGGCEGPEGSTPLPAIEGRPSFGYLTSDGVSGHLLHVCIRMGNAPLPPLPGTGKRVIPQASTLSRL